MCRFLLAKSPERRKHKELLEKFAVMSQKSKALDGDWQGDGWGISFKDVEDEWQWYHSLLPIWEDTAIFSTIPPTTHLLVHARSASFPHQKGIVAYNQPYIERNISFVFNGLLKGVSFPSLIPGAIGAQKIWSILKAHLTNHSPEQALEETVHELNHHTKIIQALNIGISDSNSFWVYNQFTDYQDYYSLHQYKDDSVSFIVSEPLEGFTSQPIDQRKVIQL